MNINYANSTIEMVESYFNWSGMACVCDGDSLSYERVVDNESPCEDDYE